MQMPVLLEPELQPYGVNRDSWKESEQQCAKTLCLTVVVLGATGDLAAKKTFPSLAALFHRGFLPESFSVIGFGRSDYSDAKLRDKLRSKLPGEAAEKDRFLSKVSYHRGPGYDQPEGYKGLADTLAAKESEHGGSVGRLFYLALPPSTYAEAMAMIKQEASIPRAEHSGSRSGNGSSGDGCKGAEPSWLRVVIEKPFGKDLESSEQLASSIGANFAEEQVYRIDHYLGKELSQNMLIMRFSNPFLSSVWNRANIANIQIVMKEDFGTQGRGGYFESYGIIRDVIQNHLLQVLGLITMERPVSMHPDDIRDEKTKLFRAIKPLRPEDAVLGQYTGCTGQPGYTDDDGVPEDSTTATYAVCRLTIDNERWEGVPMLIKAGKALNETKMEARVQFKSQAGFFGDGSHSAHGMRNEFVMQFKPKDAMYLKMVVKRPGLAMDMTMSELNLTYRDRFDEWIPEAYERLILDAIRGNQQHFVRRDELRASWAIFTPLLHAIDAGKGPTVHRYEFGSRGVAAGDKMISDAGYVRSADYQWKSKM